MSKESNQTNSPDAPAGEPAGKPSQIPRLGFFANLQASFKQIREAVHAEGKNIRKTDPLTIWLVPALAFALVCVSLSSGLIRVIVALLAFSSACLYIAARIGIVRSMNTRQVNLIWHILLCAFISGIIFAFLVLSISNLAAG